MELVAAVVVLRGQTTLAGPSSSVTTSSGLCGSGCAGATDAGAEPPGDAGITSCETIIRLTV
eukprot:4974233-Pyramimonas_sp.AAC.1